jgi:hypothetical protein
MQNLCKRIVMRKIICSNKAGTSVNWNMKFFRRCLLPKKWAACTVARKVKKFETKRVKK